MDIRDLIIKLFDIEAVKFGTFKLKSGIDSPFYIDLRLIPSYPSLLQAVAEHMWQCISDIEFDLLCGVPYTAMPIATAMALEHDIPMVMRRKEVKDYGTKRAIEGAYKAGQRCVVVEDLVTSGVSAVETIEPLQHEGLVVRDVVVLIDRQQGGPANLAERGITLHTVTTMDEVLEILVAAGRISSDEASRVNDFINDHQKVAIAR